MSALEYAKKLVSFDSVSRVSNVPVSDYVESTLRELGCETERVDYTDVKGVPKSNVIGKLAPAETTSDEGGLAYFGHTDVVPADDWKFTDHGPFEPTIKDDRLYGRGSCDMKGSVACMLAALAETDRTTLRQPVYVICTADEEIGYGGASRVVEQSRLYRELVERNAHGVIGEPTLLDVVHAHKGGCGMTITSHGRAAHSSTREGLNANLAMIPFLKDLRELYDRTENDPNLRNDEFDPPTICMNIGINDHNRALNITAPQSVCTVYFRHMPDVDGASVRLRVESLAEKHGLETRLIFESRPLYTDANSDYVRTLLELAGRNSSRTVGYGTDGGSFHELEHRLVFGPGSIAQAHTHDEWIALEQLELGTAAYGRLVQHFCVAG